MLSFALLCCALLRYVCVYLFCFVPEAGVALLCHALLRFLCT